MVCEGLLLVRAYCLSGLIACQGLLLVSSYGLSGLIACQGLLQAFGLLAHTQFVTTIANRHSIALLCCHLGDVQRVAWSFDTLIQYNTIAEEVVVLPIKRQHWCKTS